MIEPVAAEPPQLRDLLKLPEADAFVAAAILGVVLGYLLGTSS